MSHLTEPKQVLRRYLDASYPMKGTVMPTPTLLPRLVGETEKTLNAILDRHLSADGLTEQQWITLSFAAMSGDPVRASELAREVASRAKFTEDDVRARISELVDAQLLTDCGSSEVTISDAGKRLHARILGANIDVTKRLWGDLPAEDLATTARVLAAVLERADIELARGSSAVPLAGSLEPQSSQRPAR